MIYVNSKFWVYLFCFCGVICFMMGLLGYLVQTGNGSPLHLVRVVRARARAASLPDVQNKGAHNLMVESEQYLAGLIAKLNCAISNLPEANDTSADHARKANETVPVLANLSVVPLLFCFPESSRSETFNSVITRNRFNLKTSFATVAEIPVKPAAIWEAKLARVLMRDQPVILIGVNLTDLRASDVNLHLYFSMPARWQSLFLPQVMTLVATNLNAFKFRKQRLGTGAIFELTWDEATSDHLIKLDRTLGSIIRILGQIQASQARACATRKI